MDWDLIALDEIIERNRTERLNETMDFLGYNRPYNKVSSDCKIKKKKKLVKNKRKK